MLIFLLHVLFLRVIFKLFLWHQSCESRCFFSLFMELSDDLVVQLNDIYVLYYVLSATVSD